MESYLGINPKLSPGTYPIEKPRYSSKDADRVWIDTKAPGILEPEDLARYEEIKGLILNEFGFTFPDTNLAAAVLSLKRQGWRYNAEDYARMIVDGSVLLG